MLNLLDYPLLVLGGSLATFWAAAWIGGSFRKARQDQQEENPEDYRFVLGGTLTLLGLIVGFTFSMAVSRYDQRKNYEEQEANAIGTEYVRVELLPAKDKLKVHELLKCYVEYRILQYTNRSYLRLREIDAQTARLQMDLWSSVAEPSATQSSPVTLLVLSGMNDVLNSQGYTQAAWWNRIPFAAWALMMIISIFCNLLVGYGAHGKKTLLLMILPITLSISLFLIADIDSPRGGFIRVHPHNLESLAESMSSQ
jgi:hypothetical protein